MGAPTLWLVGMMGSGKTRVGRIVASRTGIPFEDTDDAVSAELGLEITEVFARGGEQLFREAEGRAIERAAGRRRVVATGGGAVLDTANVDLMRRSGTVVWLEVDPAELARRVGSGAGRPLLRGAESLEDRLSEILDGRRVSYEAAAHHRVDGGRDAEEVAREVEGLWNGS